MTDIFPPQKRSEIMSKVKSRNTKPDVLIRVFSFFILNFKDNLFRLSFFIISSQTLLHPRLSGIFHPFPL